MTPSLLACTFSILLEGRCSWIVKFLLIKSLQLCSFESIPFLKKKNNAKHSKNKSQSFMTENKHMNKDGPLKTSQTRQDQHNNFTPSLHLVSFCQLCIPQKSLHALSLSYPLNEHYSALLTRQPST